MASERHPAFPAVFISATTRDLASVRTQVKEILDSNDLNGRLMRNFPLTYQTVREKLRKQLEKCDAVIHIAGLAYGGEPKNVPDGEPRRSFTQMEYHIALEIHAERLLQNPRSGGLPVYRIVASNAFPYDAPDPLRYPAPEPIEVLALQLAHRELLMTSDHDYADANKIQDILDLVRDIAPDIQGFKRDSHQASEKVDRLWNLLKKKAVPLYAATFVMCGIGGFVAWKLIAFDKKVQSIEENLAKIADFHNQLRTLRADDSINRDRLTSLVEKAIVGQEDAKGRISQLSRSLGIPPTAISSAEALLESEAVPIEDQPIILVEFAERYRELRTLLEEKGLFSPDLDSLRARLIGGIDRGDLNVTEELLLRVQGLVDSQPSREELGVKLVALQRASWRATRATAALTRFAYREASALFEEAANLSAPYDSRAAFDYQDWSLDALFKLGEQTGESDALNEVIIGRLAQLANYPRDSAPEEWAGAQMKLGNALRALGEQDGEPARLEDAVKAYRAALEVQTPEKTPRDWARTQHNLGNALQDLGSRSENTILLQQSVDAYRLALQVRTIEQGPSDWAASQLSLGNALLLLGKREVTQTRILEAIEAYRAAEGFSSRDRAPLAWAAIQYSLGNAYTALFGRTSNPEQLADAVAAYRGALEIRTRERVPLQWSAANNGLANALLELGKIGKDKALLEEALSRYHAALEVASREVAPLDWAAAQSNIGNTLIALGDLEGGTTRHEEAVVAFRASLEELTQDRVLLDWAAVQNNLGNALLYLGRKEEGTGRLEEAATAFRLSLVELTRERDALGWARSQSNLGDALKELGERKGEPKVVEEAIEAYDAALEVRTRAVVPRDWAATQTNRGNALVWLGRRGDDSELLKEAVAAYRLALEATQRESLPFEWALMQLNLGSALIEVGKRGEGLEELQGAVDANRAAIDVFDQLGLDGYKPHAQRGINRATSLMEERTNKE